MKVDVLTLENKKHSKLDLSDQVFGMSVRDDLMARTVNWQLAKARAGTHKVKNRGEIRGSSSKIFRQKGSGRARHRNKKVSQFIGGGRAFGPVVRSHDHKLPKKIRALALCSALSSKYAAGKLIVLADASLKAPKTKELKTKLYTLGLHNALCISGDTVEHNFELASRNIINFDVLPTQGINVYDILRRDFLVLTCAAIKTLESRLK
ncbi:MAG: 50S ribosomal protein L4 [Pseudomonadota bacterium]